jgi:MerR family copper efflux transcriptional regulator
VTVAGCGPSCGCSSSAPIACTLGADDLATRLDEWSVVLAAVTDRAAIDGGLRLTFGASLDLAELARLVVAEQTCCAFFRFALTVDERGIALEVAAPADATTVLASLFGA